MQLSVQHVSFRFGVDSPWFFDDVSVTFKSGILNVIVGKNGVGKSTFFNLLRGTIDTDQEASGTISLDGITYDLAKKRDGQELSKSIHLVVQDPQSMTIGAFTVSENIAMARVGLFPSLRQLSSLSREPELLHAFNIDKAQYVNTLSGGQRQILAMVMSLQKECSVILLDEPTAALDDANARMVMECLQAIINDGVIVLFVTHNTHLIEQYQDSYSIHALVADESERRTLANIKKGSDDW